MTVLMFEASGRPRRKGALRHRSREDLVLARDAFRRGLQLGAALGDCRRRGLVSWMEPRLSPEARSLERRIAPGPNRLTRHLYVIIAMAALAAFIVFVLHL